MALIIKARSLRPSDKLILKSVCNQLPSGSRDIFSNEIYKKLEFSTEKEIETAKTHILKKIWEGNHLLEYFKFIVDTIPKADLEEILYQYEFARTGNEFVKFDDIKNQFSTGFGGNKPKKLFFVIATAYEVSVLKCLVQFLEFCLDKNRPLQYFYTDKNGFDRYVEAANNILKANKNKTKNKFDLSSLKLLEDDCKKLKIYIKNANDYLKENPEKGLPQADFKVDEDSDDTRSNNSSKNSPAPVSSHQPIQPQLTIPEAKEGNKNYYANATLKVIGRKKQKDRLRAFLKCDLNVAWFQLAGEAGQGKSRLAFNLMHEAKDLGWTAGFLRENNINRFKNHWEDWQPDNNYLLIFDYVIGREHEIKPILQTLVYDQDRFQHKIRILLVERQRWDRGNQSNKDASRLVRDTSYKASWYLNLCEDSEYRDSNLPCCFENGVEELGKLDKNDLVTIVKQLFSGKELIVSDNALRETLERIDGSGCPLYAYLLAQQLSGNQEDYQKWTRYDLLSSQLDRDKKRWRKVFKGVAPTWGDDHPAMKLAVLATIVRTIEFQDAQIKQYFGDIDSIVRREAIAITSGNLVNENIRPHEIHALEPDLLGEWFVLFCFTNDLEYKEIMDIAWRSSPNEAAGFLLRIAQNFFKLPNKYWLPSPRALLHPDYQSEADDNRSATEKLLDHIPPHKSHYKLLSEVAVFIAAIYYFENDLYIYI